MSNAQIIELKRALDVNQSMIDVSADRLERLRTQCATSAELTRQEIRTIEGKLIKLFSRQLLTKSKLCRFQENYFNPNVPSLRQWLEVVGLGVDSIEYVCKKITTLEQLQDKSEHEIKNILHCNHNIYNNNSTLTSDYNVTHKDEEIRRLTHALHNLKHYTEILLREENSNHLSGGSGAESNSTSSTPCHTSLSGDTHPLYWDSWVRDNGNSVISSINSIGGTTTTGSSGGGGTLGSNSISGVSTISSGGGSTLGSCASITIDSASSMSPRLGGAAGSGAVGPRYSNDYDHSNYNNNNHVYSSTSSINSTSTALSPSFSHYSPSTPPSTPPVFSKNNRDERGIIKFPTTPSPRKRHDVTDVNAPALLPDAQPLTKSKSHESQLAYKIDNGNSDIENIKLRRGRLPTEPGIVGQISPLLSSPIKSPPINDRDSSDDSAYKSGSNLQVPKSPRTPKTMVHVIAHRFNKTFKMVSTCDYCDKQILIKKGMRCKDCKYKCHKECCPKVPPSCGLTQEIVDVYKELISNGAHCYTAPSQSPNLSRPSPNNRRSSKATLPDSSSTSSCNSSTPASPALQICTPSSHSHYKHDVQQFNFPDVISTDSSQPLLQSQDSDKTVTLSITGTSVSTDSDKTPVRVDSQDSQVSDGETAEKEWPRQNSLSMKEWDIPWDELRMGDRIGKGHFGTVFNGNWHGEVAVKVLDVDYLDDEKMLEAFKIEVTTFRKTRHENLVLFMGACMKPPHLAIVTSKCNGHTLYTNIHIYKEKFALNKMSMVGQQISQGMGYLHARGILHKDLKSKNIFIEKNNKVVITDFGLFNFTKLYSRLGDGLSIPRGWLCYLAPEIMRSLRPHQKCEEEELPISKESDVYAFGTVWFELLCGEWPFKDQSPESIIFQVGKGMKPSLANLQASQDVKDVLMKCWSYKPGDRPDFITLMKSLEKLPKKRILARSPSHPLNLSRSAESVF